MDVAPVARSSRCWRWWFRLRGDPPAVAVGSITSASRSRRTWRVRLQPLLPLLRLAAVALFIIALARPQRGEAVSETGGEGIDIVLAYDASSSMTQPFARGQTPPGSGTSPEAFRRGARERPRGPRRLSRQRPSLSPLTADYAAVSEAVSIAPTIRLDDGTAIGTAMGESINLLRTSDSASKIVILLTDGENNSPTIEPLAAARLAESLNIRVYTIGVVSRSGNRSQSSLNVDETALREIANVTGATYNRAEDPGRIAGCVRQHRCARKVALRRRRACPLRRGRLTAAGAGRDRAGHRAGAARHRVQEACMFAVPGYFGTRIASAGMCRIHHLPARMAR